MVVAGADARPVACFWCPHCPGAKFRDCAIHLRVILSGFRDGAIQGAYVLSPARTCRAGLNASRMKVNRSSIVTVLVAVQLVVACVMIVDWLFVTTHRFYLEDRADGAKQGTAWQHFLVEGNHVVPQIVTRNDAQVTFDLNLKRSSILNFRVNSIGAGAYEIYLVKDGSKHLLATDQMRRRESETMSETLSGTVPLPSGRESLEIYNHGAVTWYDLRAITCFQATPYLAALILLFLLTLFTAARVAIPKICVRASLLLASIVVTIGAAEIGLYLLRELLPYTVSEHRRDIGAFRLDPRWEYSPRYRKRMRPNSDTYTQWEYGDLVEMAVIPSEVSRARVNHYPVRTDREGFRNGATREHIAIAALGDSFTDALMLSVGQAWPARLEQILGMPVQNYGTAGFGPQQELYVLQDYAIKHRPRVVVVAYFAGNDIFDAQYFARFEQSKAEPAEMAGWRIKKIVMRYETLYSYTLLRVAFHGMFRKGNTDAPADHPSRDAANTASELATRALPRAYFDRGMFHVPIAGHDAAFALMPPYLRTLTYSRAALEALPGWALTRHAYQEMKQLADQQGARLVVMYIPFKSQLYLPLLERSFPTEELNRDLKFYFRENQSDADATTMNKNLFAQNEMMKDFCAEAGILLLDLTPALRRQIEQGNSMYFSDDAHWNTAGHDLAARELAEFLKQHRLVSVP